MKRKDFLKHLFLCGCLLLREGGNHSIFFNPLANRCSAVPRHHEINRFLCAKICDDLGIKRP
jgi:mRNA interferase HicA